jgi:AcrR family transcriptional regulator
MGIKERKDRERTARKQAILQAAIKVFSQKGYERTNMEEIAEEAELSKGIIYYYFDSKEELFKELLLGETANYYQQAYETVSHLTDYREILAALLDFHFTYFSRRRELLSLIFPYGKSSPAFLDEEFKSRVEEVRQPLSKKINQVLGEKAQPLLDLFWSFIIGFSVKMAQGKELNRLQEEIRVFKEMTKGVLK